MKNLKFQFVTAFFIIICLQASALDVWVSPNGSDKNPGTKEQPIATLKMALRKVRELRRLHDPSVAEGVHIILRGGTYPLDEPVLVRPEDSGTAEGPTFIEAAPGEKPVFSGGVSVSGWKKAGNISGLPKEAEGKIWVADAPRIGGRFTDIRQLWVNDLKANRSSDYDEGKTLQRISSVNREKYEMWIPKPAFGSLQDARQMEFFIHQWWGIAILRVKSVQVSGDTALVQFYEPENRLEIEHPWPAPFIDWLKGKNGDTAFYYINDERKFRIPRFNGNSAFFFMNDIRFLDHPGEWYHDQFSGKIFYWPRTGEDLSNTEVKVPVLENLIQVEGALDLPVSCITFKNIEFKYTTFLRPSKAGHVPLQAGFYLLDAYSLQIPGTSDKAWLENQAWVGRQPAAVSVRNGNHINFERCFFRHLAATGLDYVSGTSHDVVEGCVFSDIGGTGIQIGFFGDASYEAHLPYDPSDRREVCSFETIRNNYITNCTNEDWGCVGISAGFVRDITIHNNELSNLNYSGICVGWGWTRTVNAMRNNKIYANHIHHFAKNMYDVAGIYTLAAQPGSEICYNSIHNLEQAPYTHDLVHWQYIYFDEGTSGIFIHDNWTEKDKFFTNTNGPGNKWMNNGPLVNDSIKNAAGLELGFRDLLGK
jgi:hypothetical protein